MKKLKRIGLSVTLIAVIAAMLVFLLPARVDITTDGNVSITLDTYEVLAAPGEVTYYFNVYDIGTVWETAPEYMADNVLTNYASTNNDNEQEKLTETNAPGNDLGTITKVELRVYGHGDGNDRIDFSFDSGQSPEYQLTMPDSPGWSSYADVTADSNIGRWTWAKVQDPTPDLWVQFDKVAGGGTMYVAKVEIRVTYSTEPKGGSVAFVRATEGAITSTVLTLNIEVSAGTDRVLVVGLAYKDASALTPTSIVFNGTENFTLEKTAIDGVDAQCFLYYLVAPTETTANVVITMPDSVRMVGYVAYFTGVAQDYPFTGNTTEAQGTDATPTVDLTSAADEIAIDVMVQVSGGPDTITSNTGTKIMDGAATGGGSDTRGGGQYDTGAAPVTMGYTMSSTDNWNIIAGALQEPWQPVSDIDVGAPPTDRAGSLTSRTIIDENNPANASGVLHSVKVWAAISITGLRVGTFYTTNGNTLKCRDSELIGGVTAGSEQTFTELSIAVEVDDYIGCYFTAGSIERDTSGFAGLWYAVGEYIDPNDETEYARLEGDAISLYGYGDIAAKPTVTTQAASNIGPTSATLNGEITDIGGGNCDERGFESRHTPSVQTTLGVGNPHGIVYYDGFVYTCHRLSPGKVVKTSVTNYASKSTLTPQHNSTDAGDLGDIIYAAGYLWTCDTDGWVYKIDLASFTVSAAYQPVADEADSLCSDGTYVYVGYKNGHIGKITIATGDTSSNDLGDQRWHAMVEEGDYLYGNDYANNDLHKIAKSDLTSVGNVAIGLCADDMAQDSTYIYLGREAATFAIVRVQKSNLSLSSQSPSGIGVCYGVFLIGSQIIFLDADNNWIWVFESDLSSKKAPLSGLDDASGINELAEDDDGNFHITQYKATDAPLVKINKYVILDAFDWTETDSYGVGAFDHIVTDLHPSVTYKYRAKAHNSAGWGYGNEVEFDTVGGADISNVPTSKDFGVVSTSTNYWSNGSPPTWPLDDSECYFTVTNNGDTCSITVEATNFTGGVGWTLSGSPGENIVTLKVGKSGDALEANMVTVTTSPQAFISGLVTSIKWELKMETPTSHTDGAEKTSVITLVATLD